MNFAPGPTPTPSRPYQARPWLSLWLRMLLPAIAAMLPLVLLAGLGTWKVAQSMHDQAEALVAARALRAADDTLSVFSAAEETVRLLAMQQSTNPTRGACALAIDAFHQSDATWSNAGSSRTTGEVLCSLRQVPGPAVAAGWFQKALVSPDVVLGPPEPGDAARHPVIHVAKAVRDGSGTALGVAWVAVDLVSLSRRIGGSEMPPGSSVAVTDAQGVVVARYPDTLRWIGSRQPEGLASASASASASADAGAGAGSRTTQASGIDGQRRLYVDATLAGMGWHALAGVPAEQLEAPMEAIRQGVAFGLAAAVLVGGAIAAWLARRAIRPLESLARTAEAVAQGDGGARATVPEGGEVQVVAEQFNRMLDRQGEVERGLRQANSLYEALFESNRAVVRGGRFEDIARAACRACVDSGNAVLVATVQGNSQSARMVAWAGPAERVIGTEAWVPARPAYAHLPLPQALATGEPFYCDDYEAIEVPEDLRESAQHHQIRAVAALPIRLRGEVWGALLIDTDRAGWFVPERRRLLEAVAADLQMALENEHREQERKEALRMLQDRDRQLAGIVETAMDGLITIDTRHRIRVFNAAAGRIFRIEPGRALGMHLSALVPPAHREMHERGVDAFARGEHAANKTLEIRRNIKGLRSTGEEFPIEASMSRHVAGDEVLMTVMLRDMSGQQELEAARQARLAAEAANQAKSVFLASVSHEIRTPLHAIMGYAQLAAHGAADQQQAGYIEKLQASAQDLLGTVDQVLDISKLEAGQLELAPSLFAIGEMLEPVRDGLAPLALAKGLTFDLQVDPGMPGRVGGDPRRIAQVLLALGGNAIKFTHAGGVRLHVSCEDAGQGSAWLQVAVQDTGIGLDPAEVARLFEPFTQADGSDDRRYGGAGLGLAISQRLARLMGGGIDVCSRPGDGSEFRLRVRVRTDGSLDAARPDAAQVASAPGAARAVLRGRRVLLVEDNPYNQEVGVALLSDIAGMDVTTAGSGAQALAALESGRFDLVLMDVQMPGMDGCETTRRLRAMPGLEKLPVIALTAHAHAQVRQNCMQAGMDDFVGKPFDMQDLFRVLERWLGASR